MKHPKVKTVLAVEDYTLVVEFNNYKKKKYDVSPLLSKESKRHTMCYT